MVGVLLINTGSPKSKERKDVKAFIGEMLSDPLVMTVPNWLRPILVKGIICPIRQFASASHYSLIWDNKQKVSPLLYNMHQLAQKLEAHTQLPVEIAMRYGEPSIDMALKKLIKKNDKLHKVVVVPLFPQYAESSYHTVVEALGACFYKQPYPFRLEIIEPYYANSFYIKALAERLKPYLATPYDRLLFSFHSLPLSHVEAGWTKGKEFDYVYQSKETIRLVSNELGLDVRKVRMVYSSAMGSRWLKPDLKETVINLAKEGAKRIIVISPGFAVDNLETLYDLEIKAKNLFLENGGTEFAFVPCLNSEDYWIDGLAKIIAQ